jgi:hypothetical protein
MTPAQFTRLPGRRFGILRRASIWDAGDYLLSVSGTSFSERYRRFYYDDIKAIVVHTCPRLGSIGAMLLTAWFTIPFIILANAPGIPRGVPWVLLIPGLWLLWLIYVNLARSCRVFIYTAVSSEELPALFRRRSAAKVIPILLSKIAERQGDFVGAPLMPDGFESPTIQEAYPPEPQPQPVGRQILYAVGSFCAMFLCSAIFAYWYRGAGWTPSNLTTAKIVFPLINAMEVGSGVWALFKLAGNRTMNSLRIFVFAGLGVLALRTYLLVFLISMVSQKNYLVNDAISNFHTRFWVGTGDCGLSTIIALAGLISLILSWQDDRHAPSESRSPLSSL